MYAVMEDLFWKFIIWNSCAYSNILVVIFNWRNLSYWFSIFDPVSYLEKHFQVPHCYWWKKCMNWPTIYSKNISSIFFFTKFLDSEIFYLIAFSYFFGKSLNIYFCQQVINILGTHLTWIELLYKSINCDH